MRLITNYLTKNDCYISSSSRADRKMSKPFGIVVHSTGANNPNLKRYVQPDIEGIGKNSNNNDWNRSGISKCVHAFIGKLNNGDIATINTLPYNFNCWGCASGKKGSFNFNPTAKIQFEICEDDLTDRNYFDIVMKEAQEYCAYLIKLFPNLTVYDITSHAESYKLGYASNHADINHWLKKFKLDMTWFRNEVYKLINTSSTEYIYYTVVSGDTLTKIAKEYKTTVNQLKLWNNLSSDLIKVGQKMIVADKPITEQAESPKPNEVSPVEPDTPPPVINQIESIPGKTSLWQLLKSLINFIIKLFK